MILAKLLNFSERKDPSYKIGSQCKSNQISYGQMCFGFWFFFRVYKGKRLHMKSNNPSKTWEALQYFHSKIYQYSSPCDKSHEGFAIICILPELSVFRVKKHGQGIMDLCLFLHVYKRCCVQCHHKSESSHILTTQKWCSFNSIQHNIKQ